MSVPSARGGVASPRHWEPGVFSELMVILPSCVVGKDAAGKAIFYSEGWTWEWDGTPEKI